MERILTYHITRQDAGVRIRTYLKRRGYSSHNLVELKKYPDGVLRNGSPVYLNQYLQENDTIVVHIQEDASSEKIVPVKLPLHILYEDEDLLVVNKPAGMPIHPSLNNYENSLGNALAWYFADQGIPFVYRCINRLDRDTSGLTVIAKHMISASILSSMMAEGHQIEREYLAIVRGCVEPAAGVVTAPLGRREGSILERTVDFEHGEHAVTHYRTLENKNGYSLISLKLETGRTHQIRVHMKYLGYPLIGDYLYNPDDTIVISRQSLHSHRLTFTHPITGQVMEFTVPLPEDMRRVLES